MPGQVAARVEPSPIHLARTSRRLSIASSCITPHSGRFAPVHDFSQRAGLSSSPVQPHPAPILEREMVWLKRVGCAHPLEPHHLPRFFLGGEWHLLISEPELESPVAAR